MRPIARRLFAAVLAIATLAATATDASAQRSAENPVAAAEDAFGVSIGRETIGLYTSSDVRGFSPVDAGNVRIDGLYFDPVRLPSSLLLASTAIRVGIASQGFAFPAPTGVVDLALRQPSGNAASSAFLGLDSNGFGTAEFTHDHILAPGRLLSHTGIAAYRGAYGNGTTERQGVLTQSLAWTPSDAVQVRGFVAASRVTDSQPPPIYLTTDGAPPPPIRLRRFNGPGWALQRRDRFTYGVLADLQPATDWRVQFGLFRSESRDAATFDNLYLDIAGDGSARQLVLADPAARAGSTSGELRVSRDLATGDTLHRFIASVRGRDRTRVFDGTDAIDLGAIDVDAPQRRPQPAFAFGPTDRDEITQADVGLSYGFRRKDVGEFVVSALSSDYRKQSTPAEGGAARIDADPVLYAGAAALHLSERWSLYASYSDGLEDSGAAPSSAANRNTPLPASATRQRDAGVRWRIRPGLTVVAGMFSLEKPYFTFDAANVFRQRGSVGNRGIELSVSGALSPSLDLVLGIVGADPEVRRADEAASEIGEVPVNQPRWRAGLNVEWRPERLGGSALTTGLTFIDRRAATSDNRAELPARAVWDVGARIPLQVAGHPSQLRFAITNVGDRRGWDSVSSGAYFPLFGRAAEVSLAIDF